MKRLSPLADENVPALIKRVDPSTVLIKTYDESGEALKQGSGFFITAKGDVITCHHVLEGATRAEVKMGDGRIYRVKEVIAEDKEADIVRISVDVPANTVCPLRVTTSLPEVGEKVIVIGSPLGLEKTVSDGIVSAVREIPGFGNIIQISAPVSPGSSGSPVVNIRGEVIGLATRQVPEGQNLNFAMPGERIAKLKPKKTQSLAEWSKGTAGNWISSSEGLYFTGLNYLWGEDYEKALPYFEKAARKNPKYAEAYFQIGYCHDQLGRYQEAIEAYKEAIRIKPDDADAQYNLGVAYGHLGRYQEAIQAYEEATRIKPDHADAHLNLGVAYGELGRYEEAIGALNEAIRIKPDYAEAHYNLGVAYRKLGRHQEEIEAYKEAIRAKPGYAEPYYGLSLAYGGSERWEEAREAFMQAIRTKPDDAKAHFGLGLAYLALGDKTRAFDEYKILERLDKDSANDLLNLIYQ